VSFLSDLRARDLRRWVLETTAPPAIEAGAALAAALSRTRRVATKADVMTTKGAIEAGASITALALPTRDAGHADAAREAGEGASAIPESDVVWLERGVYTAVSGRSARVALLGRARRAARLAVVVHVPIGDEGSHVGRAAFDAPRRVLAALGLRVAEPGDRVSNDAATGGVTGRVHRFFDDEAWLREVDDAGLRVDARRELTFVLRPRETGPGLDEPTEPFAREVARAAARVGVADRVRRREAPADALASMRAEGRRCPARGPLARARLRRAIGWVDALSPGGASCYRRVLLELALDAGAARETVVFGLDVGRTGHVAFEDREERAFDVAFAIPPPPV